MTGSTTSSRPRARSSSGSPIDCARCHDHKLDPIPQKDYYRFLAFFQNVNHYRNGGPTDEVPLSRSDVGPGKPSSEANIANCGRKRDRGPGRAVGHRRRIPRRVREGSQGGQGRPPPTSTTSRYRFYRDTWETNCPTSTPSSPSRPASSRRGSVRPRASTPGRLRLASSSKGRWSSPSDGRYTFFLDSDDGSRLTVDGTRGWSNTTASTTRDREVGRRSCPQARASCRSGSTTSRGSADGTLSVAWSGSRASSPRPLSATKPERRQESGSRRMTAVRLRPGVRREGGARSSARRRLAVSRL